MTFLFLFHFFFWIEISFSLLSKFWNLNQNFLFTHSSSFVLFIVLPLPVFHRYFSSLLAQLLFAKNQLISARIIKLLFFLFFLRRIMWKKKKKKKLSILEGHKFQFQICFIYLFIYLFILREFKFMMSALNDCSLLLDQDTNRFLV